MERLVPIDRITVSGDSGMSSTPKFSLKTYFEDVIYPMIEALTCSGGEFVGYIPIFQQDNTGPHTD